MEEPSRRKKSKEKKDKNSNKKSRVRTKFLIESLRQDYYALRDENHRLREVRSNAVAPLLYFLRQKQC